MTFVTFNQEVRLSNENEKRGGRREFIMHILPYNSIKHEYFNSLSSTFVTCPFLSTGVKFKSFQKSLVFVIKKLTGLKSTQFRSVESFSNLRKIKDCTIIMMMSDFRFQRQADKDDLTVSVIYNNNLVNFLRPIY